MLEDNLELRRSIYELKNELPVSDEKLVQLVEKCILNCPSAFNAQSARVVILFGDKHSTYWQMVAEGLAKAAAPEKREAALKRLQNFADAYGTIVFYEDTDVAEEMVKKYADYAMAIENWLQQSNAILEYMIWQCLAENKIGASLQHYGNLAEAEFKKRFDLPTRWQWVAEMPFGAIGKSAEKKDFAPIETRLKVLK